MRHHVVTPTWYSQPISRSLKQDIWLKMECFQPSLSFKLRGIGRLCEYYREQGYRALVASSGGNAGYSAACVAKTQQLPLTVYVPANTHPIYLEKIRAQGAKVEIAGAVWDDAHQVALQVAANTHAAYIPPFDHPLIWAGNSTLIDEVVEQMPKPSAIVTAVGGGGLAVGIVEGLQRYGWSDVPVYGIEPVGAAAFATSLKADRLVHLPTVHTIMTTLATKHVCQRLLDLTHTHPMHALSVEDRAGVQACYRFLDDHQVLVEPSCGAALAAVYEKAPVLAQHRSILVIVCGGVGISQALLQQYASEVGAVIPGLT